MGEIERIEKSQPSGDPSVPTEPIQRDSPDSRQNNALTRRSWFSRFFPGLPDYLGRFPVGMHDIETPADATKGTHGVLIRLYYPTMNESRKSHGRAKWLPKGAFYSMGYGNFSNIPAIISLGLFYPILAGVKTPGYLDAPLRPAAQELPNRLPVVIFSHGLGGMRTTYSTFCGNLASQGFIVAAIEHRDGSAAVSAKNAYKEKIAYRRPENEKKKIKPGESVDEFLLRFRRGQVQVKAGEVKEVVQLLRDLDEGVHVHNIMVHRRLKGFEAQFKGRFDFDNWVMAGHSFGAATTLTALQDPTNPFRCGIALDPWMHAVDDSKHIRKPFISVQSESFHWKSNLDPLMSFFNHPKCAQTSRFGVIRSTAHQDISDFPPLFPGLMKKIKLGGTADPVRSLQLYHAYHMAFLKEQLDTELDLGQYPGFEKECAQRPNAIIEGREAFLFLSNAYMPTR